MQLKYKCFVTLTSVPVTMLTTVFFSPQLTQQIIEQIFNKSSFLHSQKK